MLTSVKFGELVKVIGGRDARHRSDVAERFRLYNKQSLGLDAERLSLYGDEYVAYKAPWDSEEEGRRVDELRFRHNMIRGAIYGDTRGVRSLAERLAISDEIYDRYRWKLEEYLGNPTERDAAELEQELDREFPKETNS